jgi:hypothetical protein
MFDWLFIGSVCFSDCLLYLEFSCLIRLESLNPPMPLEAGIRFWMNWIITRASLYAASCEWAGGIADVFDDTADSPNQSNDATLSNLRESHKQVYGGTSNCCYILPPDGAGTILMLSSSVSASVICDLVPGTKQYSIALWLLVLSVC